MVRNTISGIGSWTRHQAVGGGAFPGEVCIDHDGLLIRDLLNDSKEGFKTEFNLETNTYQFYSICNPRVIRRFVNGEMTYLFPVTTLPTGTRVSFGFITVCEYKEKSTPQYLQEAICCSGRKPPAKRYILKLDQVCLVSVRDAFELYSYQEWREKIGCDRPSLQGRRLYYIDLDRAERLKNFFLSKKDLTKLYLERTLALKRELKLRYQEFLADPRFAACHVRHLKGLWQETDYFDHM